jgi:hypothetical protein
LRKNSGFGLESENTAVGMRHADHATPFYPQNVALASLKTGGHSVGIVLSRTQAKEFVIFLTCYKCYCEILLFSPTDGGQQDANKNNNNIDHNFTGITPAHSYKPIRHQQPILLHHQDNHIRHHHMHH